MRDCFVDGEVPLKRPFVPLKLGVRRREKRASIMWENRNAHSVAELDDELNQARAQTKQSEAAARDREEMSELELERLRDDLAPHGRAL